MFSFSCSIKVTLTNATSADDGSVHHTYIVATKVPHLGTQDVYTHSHADPQLLRVKMETSLFGGFMEGEQKMEFPLHDHVLQISWTFAIHTCEPGYKFNPRNQWCTAQIHDQAQWVTFMYVIYFIVGCTLARSVNQNYKLLHALFCLSISNWNKICVASGAHIHSDLFILGIQSLPDSALLFNTPKGISIKLQHFHTSIPGQTTYNFLRASSKGKDGTLVREKSRLHIPWILSKYSNRTSVEKSNEILQNVKMLSENPPTENNKQDITWTFPALAFQTITAPLSSCRMM